MATLSIILMIVSILEAACIAIIIASRKVGAKREKSEASLARVQIDCAIQSLKKLDKTLDNFTKSR